MSERFPIGCEMYHAVLASGDVRNAVRFYVDKLGFSLGFEWGDPVSMAGVELGRVSVHLSSGAPSPTGCSLYFVVDDCDALHARHLKNGVDVLEPPVDRPWGLREYAVRDPNGYELRFGHRVPARSPPIEIERIDVEVRLERRLAGLLADLAKHKRMTLGECLEETLLHTFEAAGDGEASNPYSQHTLAHIAELREQHGIDYDAHDAYRFVEAEDAEKSGA